MHESNKFYWLDLLRGLAAFTVFIGHLRSIFFIDYMAIKPNITANVFYFITGFGRQSVIIFFVLSGFFIAKTVHDAAENKKWAFGDYFINRFIRLQTVLLPALILGICFDTIGLSLFSKSVGYSITTPSMPDMIPVGRLNATTFWGNLFFLQTIFVTTFGSNSPLWSLANEFWYYMVFPLFYFSLIKRYPSVNRPFYLLMSIIILIMIGKIMAAYLIIWLIGALVFHIRHKYQSFFETQFAYLNLTFFTVFTVFLGLLSLIRCNVFSLIVSDFILGIISGILILLLSFFNMKQEWVKKITTYLSNISYTLYLTHVPAALLICSWISYQRHDWNYSNLLIFSGILFLLLGFSTLIWYIFERNTSYLKRIFKSELRGLTDFIYQQHHKSRAN